MSMSLTTVKISFVDQTLEKNGLKQWISQGKVQKKQACKLQDAQAEKLTSLQAHKLTPALFKLLPHASKYPIK